MVTGFGAPFAPLWVSIWAARLNRRIESRDVRSGFWAQLKLRMERLVGDFQCQQFFERKPLPPSKLRN
jgi:hypothetical protein